MLSKPKENVEGRILFLFVGEIRDDVSLFFVDVVVDRL
jgi:hypothetical protein